MKINHPCRQISKHIHITWCYFRILLDEFLKLQNIKNNLTSYAQSWITFEIGWKKKIVWKNIYKNCIFNKSFFFSFYQSTIFLYNTLKPKSMLVICYLLFLHLLNFLLNNLIFHLPPTRRYSEVILKATRQLLQLKIHATCSFNSTLN